jgi:hypothetical protein
LSDVYAVERDGYNHPAWGLGMNRYKLHSKIEKVGWFLFIVMSAARDLSLVSKAHAYAVMGKKKIMTGMSSMKAKRMIDR